MGIIFRFAWRNIWRSPRRTILTLLAVAFATAVLMFFIGIQLRAYDTAIRSTTSLFHGHLQVQAPGYFDRPQIRTSISHYDEALALVQETEGVVSASPRGIGFAMISSGERTYGVQVVGVDFENEGSISTLPHAVRKGRFFQSTDEQSAVIGVSLAENLKASLGSELTILGQGRDGSLAAGIVTVVGILESGSTDIDRSMIQMPMGAFQSLFTMENNIHTIVVRVNDISEIPIVQKRIEKSLEGKNLSVLRWDELLPGLQQSIRLDMSAGWLFYISLTFIVAISVLNTFLMSILERTKEFGVMLSVGASPRNIFRLVILEGILLTISGVIVGIVCGSLIVSYYGRVGFQIPGSEQIMQKWNLPGAIYPALTTPVTVLGPLAVSIMSFVALLYPAWKVRRLKPLEALRSI